MPKCDTLIDGLFGLLHHLRAFIAALQDLVKHGENAKGAIEASFRGRSLAR
jgi:hypothetical protein